MTENHNDDVSTDELAADLAAALHHQADGFEPRPESFLRLQQAAADQGPQNLSILEPGRRRFPGRYFAAAALVCATVGGIGLLANTSRGTDLQTVPADSTTAPATSTTAPVPVTSTTVPDDGVPTNADGLDDSTAEIESNDETAVATADDQLIAGPRRSTRQAAARDFMALIRLRFARIDIEGDTATVFSFDPDGNVGQPVSTLTFTPVRLSTGADGFAVAMADAPEAAIESPTPGAKIDGSAVMVSGTGQGFEGGLGVRIYSSFDGLLFDMVGATGGNFDGVAPYAADLRVSGREMGWVVVQSSTGADVTAPFSAVPIEWDAGPDPTSYTVSHITPNDPDDGLNIRSLPALGEGGGTVLDTLSPGTIVRRRGDVPAFVGSQVWWSVSTDDGVEGWVNRRFLVRDGEVSNQTLELIGEQFLQEFASLDGQFARHLPWSTTKPVKIGWALDMTDVDPVELLGSDFWADEHKWAVPEAAFSEPVITARFSDLLGFPLTEAADGRVGYSFIPNQPGDGIPSPYPQVADALESQFAGLAQVQVVPVTDSSGNEHPAFTLYVEPGPNGASIVGVSIDFWIP